MSKHSLGGFALNILTIFIGTIFFGAILEKFKVDESFRTTLVKEYYSPIKAKELECAKVNNKIASAYNQMFNDYSLLREQYLSFKKNESPALTNEYKSFLENTLISTIKIGKETQELNIQSQECMDSLYQLQIEASLVTGSYHAIKSLHAEKKQNEDNVWGEFKSKTAIENKELIDIDANKIIKIFFNAGDLSREIPKSESDFTDNLVQNKIPKIISVFSKRAESQIKSNNINNKYNNDVNKVLEEELNNRFKRGWLSYIGM